MKHLRRQGRRRHRRRLRHRPRPRPRTSPAGAAASRSPTSMRPGWPRPRGCSSGRGASRHHAPSSTSPTRPPSLAWADAASWPTTAAPTWSSTTPASRWPATVASLLDRRLPTGSWASTSGASSTAPRRSCPTSRRPARATSSTSRASSGSSRSRCRAAYNASKYAVRGFTESLRQELELDRGRASARPACTPAASRPTSPAPPAWTPASRRDRAGRRRPRAASSRSPSSPPPPRRRRSSSARCRRTSDGCSSAPTPASSTRWPAWRPAGYQRLITGVVANARGRLSWPLSAGGKDQVGALARSLDPLVVVPLGDPLGVPQVELGPVVALQQVARLGPRPGGLRVHLDPHRQVEPVARAVADQPDPLHDQHRRHRVVLDAGLARPPAVVVAQPPGRRRRPAAVTSASTSGQSHCSHIPASGPHVVA